MKSLMKSSLLSNATFTLTDEGDVGAFLGVDIKQNATEQLEITQAGLIS